MLVMLATNAGPLARLGMNLSPGDFIVSINHSRLTEFISPERALANHAEREVYVNVVQKQDMAAAQQALCAEKGDTNANEAVADLMALLDLEQQSEPKGGKKGKSRRQRACAVLGPTFATIFANA